MRRKTKRKTNRTERRRMATNKLTKPHTQIKQKADGRTDRWANHKNPTTSQANGNNKN